MRTYRVPEVVSFFRCSLDHETQEAGLRLTGGAAVPVQDELTLINRHHPNIRS